MATLREELEHLVRQEEATRLRRLELDRNADPQGYVRADAAWAAATRQLAAAAREALRETGLLRDASRALRGTGYTITRFPLEDGVLRVELAGGPDNPVEFLHVPVRHRCPADPPRRLLHHHRPGNADAGRADV